MTTALDRKQRKQLSSGDNTLSREWAVSPIRTRRKDKVRVIPPGQWAQEAAQAAIDAMFAVADLCDVAAALEAGRAAFRANMPPLNCPSMIRGYVACIGEGVRADWLTPEEARQCVRLAHAAMIAHNMGRKGAA